MNLFIILIGFVFAVVISAFATSQTLLFLCRRFNIPLSPEFKLEEGASRNAVSAYGIFSFATTLQFLGAIGTNLFFLLDWYHTVSNIVLGFIVAQVVGLWLLATIIALAALSRRVFLHFSRITKHPYQLS